MKGKTRKQKVIAAICLVLVWIAVLWLIQCLVVPKYQTGVVEGSMTAEYYKDKSKHEVLMVGDCEVYENISTIELWRKYGITSYIRGSAQQLVWHSYYMLEDALRYETPKVVVFNVLALKYNEPQSEAYNRMSIDGMRWSKSKVEAIKASMMEDEHFIDYVFPLFRYHSRWSELDRDDFKHIFKKDPVTHSGYYMRVDVRPQEEFPDPTPLTDYTLGEKAMSYLDKMTELCKEKGIKLVLIKAPVEFPHWYDEWDKQMVEYAEENGLDYLNFISLRDDAGIDMSTDTYDAGLHLNVSGAEKMADYFGAWLTENCDLTDCRTDKEYSELWQKKTELYEQEKTNQYKELREYGKIVSKAPVETKETNVMKNFIILVLVAALCLTLVACSGGDKKPADSGNEPAGTVTSDGYTVKVKGTEVALDAKMAPLAETLGEPTKYFESESCAFQGLDKVYTYGGVVISTYPMDEVDYVLSVELKDDTVSTAEGVSIGDSLSKVTEKYGDPTETLPTAVSYTKGGVKLSFFLENDAVTSITYTKA